MKTFVNAFIVAFLWSSVALAQSDYKDAHKLGGSTSFSKSKLLSVGGVNKFVAAPSVRADIGVVLETSGLADLKGDVLAALDEPTTVQRDSCSNLSSPDGVLVSCQVYPGTTMEWMAYRPKGKVDRLLKLRWAADKPFEAYAFRVTKNSKIYTFVIPVVCGNLTLLSVADVPIPPPPSRPPVTIVPPITVPPIVVPPPAPEPTPPAAEPFVPPVIAPAPKPSKVSFFIDGIGGKDRRTRHADQLVTTDGHFVRPNGVVDDYTQCSPLVGLKFGVAKKFDNLWEVAGTGGVALSVVTDKLKVRQNEYFTDFEVNKYTSENGGFVGTGITFWDVTHKDTWAPGALVHFGIPVGNSPVYVVGEGRVFFDRLDDIQNNYQVWAGIRVKL